MFKYLVVSEDETTDISKYVKTFRVYTDDFITYRMIYLIVYTNCPIINTAGILQIYSNNTLKTECTINNIIHVKE